MQRDFAIHIAIMYRNIRGVIEMADFMMSLLHADTDEKMNLDMLTRQLLSMLSMKSQALFRHSVQVSYYAESIAIKMGLPYSEVEQIKYAALLHDIGLLTIPNILLKKFPYLNRQEKAKYKQHPVAGVSLIENYPCCQDILPYILYHHERWDGSGYPKHLKQVNIPLGARIIAVADYYDATINPSTEFWAKTKQEATRELLSASGILFDPEVIHAFIQTLK